MFATLIFATLLSLLTVRTVAEFDVVTPKFTQCASAHFTWDDTSAIPYSVIVANNSDPCGNPVADLGDHNGTSLTWNVTVPGGWTVVISIEDSKGNEAWSGPILVQQSDDDGCLSGNKLATAVSSTDALPSSSSSYPSVTATPSSHVVTSPAATSGAANAETTPKKTGTGGINGALSARGIPAPAILLGAIGFAFNLAL